MKFKELVITATLATLLFCGAGWAQQTPDTQNQPDPPTKSSGNVPKEKHLSGSLVDMNCMAKTLGAEVQTSPQAVIESGAPHLTSWDGASPQTGQVPSPVNPGNQGNPTEPGQRNPETGPPVGMPTSGVSADQQAQITRESKVDNAARQCVASPLTQAIGLAMSDGQVLQFDQDGNAKAIEALKNAEVQPGKKIQAKVTGLMEDKTTVKVASIDIKGKAKRGTPESANPGT